ncbi:4-hydroxy-tetrahydrodipicolinate reductase [Fulvivirga sp. RKSG066]|uniref:4-hydroxy-tetrahydrodipicolinate reductase n=1 Tax=Fulvivirga aurantia TaxID=2529383 RepID=UPI0012BB52AF|nr:4-hydroxy-tetrahydrodipicolinate reductase [Fulvivirga aurantia]MTI20757.1 4-hydroxy-tetrahydrodipicolinate reductase [Fulvivirga aurantia]
MNILILGYGKMGQIIDQMATERGHTIIARIKKDNAQDLEKLDTAAIDVAIEFSQPDAAVSNISYCLKNNIPVLSGTTGWLDKKPEIEKLCQEENGTFFYASNYSIGVNLFFKLNEQLAAMMDKFDEYDISIDEIHHTQKKDAPSGTAITLAEGVLSHVKRTKEWKLGERTDGAIPIAAIRKDDVPGTHGVCYSSSIDDIEIKHTAHSREGFAKGAVLVAEWLKDKKGVLSMAEFLKL